ncbi:aminotransferase class I/II-fold pyridoxal phosphate-dependent enzyme, partial [Staphylococcus capitis]|uniref:aminotransferase class I/II-fold pyridoxal phosphate-dependent enzyme n=1 Tax=Staphylococcus capitis TaxID=29388 RepID=UPI000D473BA2
LLLPVQNWGNYKLIFNTRHGADIQTYSIFDEQNRYTTDGFVEALENYDQDKVILLLNYPNNPTGYTPTADQGDVIGKAIKDLADRGTKVITIVDDAYYGLVYEDVYTQSLFSAVTQLESENILPVRLDGATKE